ncbi:MAG: hypothetical protein H6807_07000 [Planctomycetes bacterium]|nr:hypothetical protein [Planctomycetota bacterium]
MTARHERHTPQSRRQFLLGHYDAGTRTFRAGLLLGLLLPLLPVALLVRFSGLDFEDHHHVLSSVVISVTGLVLYAGFLDSLRLAASRPRFLREWRGWATFLTLNLAATVLGLVVGGELGLEAVMAAGLFCVALHRGIHGLMRSRLFDGRPALALGATFIMIIGLGSIFLWLSPRALAPGRQLSLVDAIFTATSATCVTGLEVVPTVETFSPFGQGIVLLLIQLGGLGIMTLGTFLVLSSGHRMGVSDRAMVRASMNLESAHSLSGLMTAILLFTISFELIGALCLLPWFVGGEHPFFGAVFHSISAFCNAGFALDTQSFIPHSSSWTFNGIVMVLITAGGLGFTVLSEVFRRLRMRLEGKRLPPMSLHSRIVLSLSLALVLIAAVGFYFLERDASLAGKSAGESVLASLFQSVSARTAGFATVPFSGEGGMSQAGRFMLIPFMLIGASPGSTGGGIKTVTFMVLVLAIISEMRRRRNAEAMGRRIADSIVKQAGAVVMIYALTLFGALLALLISEGDAFRLNELLFEAVSAIGTVGFSCGVSTSPELSDFGKLVFVALMFAGRVGPLTLVLFAASNRVPAAIDYPEERVIIG